MKKILATLALAFAVLATPSTVHAEVWNSTEHGCPAEDYGIWEYDTATKTMTVTASSVKSTSLAYNSVIGYHVDVNHFVVKGTPTELYVYGDDTTQTIDVSEADFSKCTWITFAKCSNLKTIKGFEVSDLSN